MFFQNGCHISYFHQHCMRVPISSNPYEHLLFSIFWVIAILVGVKCYLILVFCLHFPDDWRCWTCFQVLVGHLYTFFREMFIQLLCPFINLVVVFLLWNCKNFFIFSGYYTLVRFMICRYFLQFHGLSFHFLIWVLVSL